MVDRDQIIEAMARAAYESLKDYDRGWPLVVSDPYSADIVSEYRREAAAALAAAEAAGMRFVGSGEAVVPRVMTKEMRRKAELCFTVEGVWSAAVAATEKDQ